MIKPVHKTLIALLLFIGVVVGLFVWRMTSPFFVDHAQLQGNGIFLFPEPRPVPTLNLTDYQGKSFTNEQLKGKWSFIFFGFTSCGDVCPTSLAELSRVEQSQVQNKIPTQYLFFSIDPKRDTPEKIAQYVSAFNKHFIGVTALQKDLPDIGSALNVVIDVPKEHDHDNHEHDHNATPEIDHSANVVIINPNGQYHGFIRGGFKADTIIPFIPAILNSF